MAAMRGASGLRGPAHRVAVSRRDGENGGEAMMMDREARVIE